MQFTTVALSAILSTLSLAAPSMLKRQAAANCGIHVVQYQKNLDRGPNYTFDFRIYNSIQQNVGGANGVEILDRTTYSLTSELPATIEVSVGSVDADSIGLAYNGQSWSTASGQCSVGGYEDGNRELDCGFQC